MTEQHPDSHYLVKSQVKRYRDYTQRGSFLEKNEMNNIVN